jgi:hypothetical protein
VGASTTPCSKVLVQNVSSNGRGPPAGSAKIHLEDILLTTTVVLAEAGLISWMIDRPKTGANCYVLAPNDGFILFCFVFDL